MNEQGSGHTRRGFLQRSALAAGAALAAAESARARTHGATRPNILFIISDQLSIDAIAAHGCAAAYTPNLDRLIRRGVSFQQSYSTNPVCSPARSSLFTGRMPVETGVITNGRPIHDSMPQLGQWLGQAGYETVHCGKWHLPYGYPLEIDGFTVLPVGHGQGDLLDPLVADACEAYLKTRDASSPFFLVASFMQPHDICYWALRTDYLVPEHLPFPRVADELPELPPNLRSSPPGPDKVRGHANLKGLSDEQWRYYNYIYYRQVEMLDAEVGHLLDALEDSGQAENTVIVFTADHGECGGRHEKHGKWTPYQESANVPLVVSWPGNIPEGVQDRTHLVSGLDVMSTLCDYADTAPPPGVHGHSLRPILEQRDAPWRDHVVIETRVTCRAVRTARYKYVEDPTDPQRQFFDLQEDPWEMNNLCDQARYADLMADHQKLLREWDARMAYVDPTPEGGYWPPNPA